MPDYHDVSYNEINNLTDRLEATLRELQEKEEALQTAAQIGQQIVNQNEELSTQIEGQKEKLDHWESSAKLAQREVQILEATLQNSQLQCSDLQGRLQDQERELKQIRNNISDSQARESMMQTKKVGVGDLMAGDAVMEHAVYKKLQAEHRQILNELKSEKERRAKLTETLGTLQEELQTLREVRQTNQRLTQEMKEKKTEYEREVGHRAQKEKQMSDELVNLVESNYYREGEIQEQKELLQHANDELARLRQEVSKLKAMEAPSIDLANCTISSEDTSDQKVEERSLLDEINATPQPEPEILMEPPRGNPPPLTPSREARRKDAMNEFIHLTVMSAKIKYSTVEVSTDTLHKVLEEQKLPFHQIYEFLTMYMEKLQERQLVEQDANVKSPQRNVDEPEPPGSLRKSFSTLTRSWFGGKKRSKKERNLPLQVRFGKRAFQINMAPDDHMKRMLKAFPPMVGQDADQVVFVSGDQILDAALTVEESGLTTDHVIRMLPLDQLHDYMEKVKRKSQMKLMDA